MVDQEWTQTVHETGVAFTKDDLKIGEEGYLNSQREVKQSKGVGGGGG